MDKITEKKYLVLDPGSASKKCALYVDATEVFKIHLEKENGKFIGETTTKAGKEKISLTEREYRSAFVYILDLLKKNKFIEKNEDISGVGLRIVAPGKYFLEDRIVDAKFIKNLETAQKEAPLHVTEALLEIKEIQAILPSVVIAGISDSAWNSTMNEVAKHYSLPIDLAEKYGIYRFGYHGISMQSVVSKIKLITDTIPSRVIICHLGSGSSIVAVKDGKCFDTSMGFTPLEGVPMATRIGNIDAGAILYLLKKTKMKPDELGELLNSKCGLLGLSGTSSDTRELITLSERGDEKAKLALESFVYGVKKYIGEYIAVLGGIDMLVFTATIGERSSIMREKICEGLQNLGIVLDKAKNDTTVSTDTFIQNSTSKVKIAVICTEELKEIAGETAKLI
ncbi:MAG: acetate/propionate family kinase [Candidatus Pacebacteria bacterium]|nr:acetate/propionate family kinase [Candidatus Paceibacterota bacterium]